MIPRHVGYIMDGNGRWATLRGLPRSAGYKEGLKAMLEVLRRTEERGVQVCVRARRRLQNAPRTGRVCG